MQYLDLHQREIEPDEQSETKWVGLFLAIVVVAVVLGFILL